jgi:hypothetical protein
LHCRLLRVRHKQSLTIPVGRLTIAVGRADTSSCCARAMSFLAGRHGLKDFVNGAILLLAWPLAGWLIAPACLCLRVCILNHCCSEAGSRAATSPPVSRYPWSIGKSAMSIGGRLIGTILRFQAGRHRAVTSRGPYSSSSSLRSVPLHLLGPCMLWLVKSLEVCNAVIELQHFQTTAPWGQGP